jgi:hypothetical protein
MFRASLSPSSGAQTTATTASGNRYTVLLYAAIVEGSSQVQLCRSKEFFRHHIFLYIFHFFRNERHTNEILVTKLKEKGKATPLQAWRGPEGSRKLRLPDFKAVGT